jgi:hypothetical protein
MWPGSKKCAISFAYIGGLAEHVDLATPLLRNLDFNASFYVDPASVLANVTLWANLIDSNHEFGVAPFETASSLGELTNWTTVAVRDEIRSSKKFVREFFHKDALGIAHRGEALIAGEKDCTVMLTDAFDHVLTDRQGLNDGYTVPHQLATMPLKRYPSSDLTKAMTSSTLTWLIIPFRRIFLNYETLLIHRMVLEAVNRHRNYIYVAPVSEVAAEMKRIQSVRDIELL